MVIFFLKRASSHNITELELLLREIVPMEFLFFFMLAGE